MKKLVWILLKERVREKEQNAKLNVTMVLLLQGSLLCSNIKVVLWSANLYVAMCVFMSY